MSLFSLSDLEQATEAPAHTRVLHRRKRPAPVIACDGYRSIGQAITGMDPHRNYVVINYGVWSMLHLLLYLVRTFTGKAEVWITTWSINEDVIKQLVMTREQELIGQIHFLFDYRVKKYRPGAYFLAEKNFDTRITSCHAKVTVIRGEKMDVTVLGSANYTRNNRIEAMMIIPGKQEADDHQRWIDERLRLAAGA